MSWPFDTWLRIAVIRFGISPDAFWKLSLHDWRSLTRTEGMTPLPREAFDALRSAYPDGGTDET